MKCTRTYFRQLVSGGQLATILICFYNDEVVRIVTEHGNINVVTNVIKTTVCDKLVDEAIYDHKDIFNTFNTV